MHTRFMLLASTPPPPPAPRPSPLATRHSPLATRRLRRPPARPLARPSVRPPPRGPPPPPSRFHGPFSSRRAQHVDAADEPRHRRTVPGMPRQTVHRSIPLSFSLSLSISSVCSTQESRALSRSVVLRVRRISRRPGRRVSRSSLGSEELCEEGLGDPCDAAASSVNTRPPNRNYMRTRRRDSSESPSRARLRPPLIEISR